MQLLETGRFDVMFLADVIGVYDPHRSGPQLLIAEVRQIPVNDPVRLIPVMAYSTEYLGFAFPSSVLSNLEVVEEFAFPM